MSKALILASGSVSRRALLEGAGLKADTIKPFIDEEAAKTAMRAEGLEIGEQAMRLAELKALKVSNQNTGLVIGGDQMLALDDTAFDKPASMSEARVHLEKLSGKVHTLETAIVVAENGQIVWRHLAQPNLMMRPLSAGFITYYLETMGEDLLTTVGAYKLESLGSQLFTKIEGDYFSILGLPLLPLLDYLRTRGVLKS